MDEPVRHITIVGGGTAGWLSAIMLRGRLDTDRRGPEIKITLIESPNVGIIGVGEGTFAGFVEEMRSLGVKEPDFMRRCNASVKLGVRFAGWNGSRQAGPYNFIHPFVYGDSAGGKNPLLHFLAFGPHPGCDPRDVADSLHAISQAIRLKKGPRSVGGIAGKQVEDRFARYGYHFDATRLAEYLKELAVQRGVEHILDDVDDATVTEGDIITHLRLRERGLFPVEFVIDCSGFKALLISKVLKEPFVSYSKSLLCDRALALQVPHRDPTALEPCTTATALGAGWSFALPLFHRVGTGYVFSSAFRTDEEAKLEYCQHLGVDPDKVEPRAIAMRVGRSRRAWVGNCVAVGLAGGFIEPLEATAIMATQMSILHLWRHMPNRSMQKALRDRYNQTIGQIQDQIRDFITMHYFLSNRNDPFWRAARAPEVLSDELGDNLEVWRHRLPYAEDLPNASMFNHMSYGICLSAKGFYRGRSIQMQSNVRLGHWRHYGVQLASVKAGMGLLPSLYDWLVQLRRTDRETGQTAQEPALA